MARGQYVVVTYRTGAGVLAASIEATTIGSEVVVTMPGRGELFIIVDEVNSVSKTVRTARFLASEVLSIVEGQAPAQKAVKARK